MTKEAIKIETPAELERSVLDLLFRLYFDNMSRGMIDNDTNEVKIIIANDSSSYWTDITKVMNSEMHICEIKKGLVDNQLYKYGEDNGIFNTGEFDRLVPYDFFTISADYKSTREVAKYTVVFKFPEFVYTDSVKSAIRSIQNAISVGLIKIDALPDIKNILIENIMFGKYSKHII